MEDQLQKINMGSSSPDIALPPPVLSEDQDDDLSMSSYQSSLHDGDSSVSSGPLSISIASLPSGHYHQAPAPPAYKDPEHAQEAETRCKCVHEMQEAILRPSPKDPDDATVDSDLDSNAFYWQPSPPVMRKEYSIVLDKAIEKKSTRLSQLLAELNVQDESVKIAVKELVTSNDKVSHILKRMHEGMTSKNDSAAATSKSKVVADKEQDHVSNPSSFLDSVDASVKGADLKIIPKLAGKCGYFFKDGSVWAFEDKGLHVADVEQAKMGVLRQLLEPSAQKYDEAYTALRKALREVVTSGQ